MNLSAARFRAGAVLLLLLWWYVVPAEAARSQPSRSSRGGSPSRTSGGIDSYRNSGSGSSSADGSSSTTVTLPQYAPMDEKVDEEGNFIQGPSQAEWSGSDTDVVEKDFKEFFSEVNERFRNIVRKRHIFIANDPHTIQGIPIIFNSFTTGFNIGVRLALYNIRRTDPYKAGIILQYWESDRGRKSHRVGLDFPKIFNSNWRIKFNAEYNSSVTETFVGVGLMSIPDKHLSDLSQPGNMGLRYYDFRRMQTSVALKTVRSLGDTPFNVEASITYQYTKIAKSDLGPQQIFDQRPLGVGGGITSYVGMGLSYDTRDFEPYPTKGHYSEFFVTEYPSWLSSTYQFTRLTLTDRVFIPLRPKIVFAHLWCLEGILGDSPFYELGVVGGLDPRDISGGRDAMRGFFPTRFLGDIKWLHQIEVRYEFGQANWWRQRFDFSFVPHFDLIRVWDKHKRFTFDQFVPSGGWGVRARWNKNFVVRADFAFSRENQLVQLGFGNTF